MYVLARAGLVICYGLKHLLSPFGTELALVHVCPSARVTAIATETSHRLRLTETLRSRQASVRKSLAMNRNLKVLRGTLERR